MRSIQSFTFMETAQKCSATTPLYTRWSEYEIKRQHYLRTTFLFQIVINSGCATISRKLKTRIITKLKNILFFHKS